MIEQMGIFRFKQIGLAACLMASLLVGSASACMCSHHEVKKTSVKTSCHGVVHETVETATTAETTGNGNAIATNCTCPASRTAPYVASKSESEKSKGVKDKAVSSAVASVPVLIAADSQEIAVLDLDGQLSYSSTLKSLLPARAPPRL